MKKVLSISLFCLGSFNLMAQNWINGGNALTARGTLGTNTNFSVLFKTNNSERGRVTNSGLWGFGTASPNSRVHINSATGQLPFRVEVNGSTKLLVHSAGGVSVGSSTTAPANGLFVAGNTGIGTATPENKLHVFKGSAGIVTGDINSSLIVENSTDNFISILAPNAAGTGIIFGKPESNVSGSVVYNSSFPNVPNGLQFRTNGNITRMTITSAGQVGIGTTTPTALLDIDHDAAGSALTVTKSGTGNAANFTSKISDFPTLEATNNASGSAIHASSDNGMGIVAITLNSSKFAGFFLGNVFSNGSYQGSDEKLKQNIRDFTSAMGIINELHPKLYQFKKDGKYGLMQLPPGDHYGLIAQDVEKLLPNLVKETKVDTRIVKREQTERLSPADEVDFKALNYIELIPIMIKGMQEQDAKIEALTQLVNKLQDSLLSSGSKNSHTAISVTLSSASLDQNIPNPLTNSTSIRYNIPAGSSKAQLIVTDNNGHAVKQIQLNSNGSGTVNLETSTLSSGTYSYTLIIDGKTIATKMMVLAK